MKNLVMRIYLDKRGNMYSYSANGTLVKWCTIKYEGKKKPVLKEGILMASVIDGKCEL